MNGMDTMTEKKNPVESKYCFDANRLRACESSINN